MTHKFKPGDKVGWKDTTGVFTFVEWDEGRCTIKGGNGSTYRDTRPSELTPADPGPDAVTLLVRELCAAEAYSHGDKASAVEGYFDNTCIAKAFAKYIRANPPQPELIAAKDEQITRLQLAVIEAAHWFNGYANQHSDKAKSAKTLRENRQLLDTAQRNREHKAFLLAVLESSLDPRDALTKVQADV